MGEDDFVRALVEELAEAPPDEVEIVRQGAVKPTTALRLDLATASEVMSMVSIMFFDKSMVSTLQNVFRRTRPKRISMESPFGKFTFEPTADLTDDELREILRRLAEL